MTEVLRGVFRLVLRIFFRRVEVAGADRVPATGPVMFVLNHPNGLIDPAFLLCLAPRRVSFLAKAPLFRMPVVGWFCRRLQAIPVYRRQDEGSDPAHNRITFEAARRVLAQGGAIAIFPEGTTHSDPRLRPLRTGAARIVLGAAAALSGSEPIQIVPASLYYRAKQTFRSAALLRFGSPFPVAVVPIAPGTEPPEAPVRELTARIARELEEVTLQAERGEALALVARAQRIFSTADEPPGGPPSLAEELDLRRRFLLGLELLHRRRPDRITALQARIERYETALAAAGIDARHVTPRTYTVRRTLGYVAQSLLVFALLFPAALVGAIPNYPAYRIVGFVATGIAKRDEATLASVKVLAAMLLFPVSWGLVATLVWLRWGGGVALAVVVVLPLAGYGSLLFFERLDRVIGRGRALGLLVLRRRAFLRLAAERRAIHGAIVALGRELDLAAP